MDTATDQHFFVLLIGSGSLP